MGRRPVAIRNQLEEVRNVAVHHFRLADVFRAVVRLYLLPRVESGLAEAIRVLARYHLFQRDDVRAVDERSTLRVAASLEIHTSVRTANDSRNERQGAFKSLVESDTSSKNA